MEVRPRGVKELTETTLDIWDHLEDEIRVKIVDTFAKRIKQCVDLNGGFTEF